MAINPTEQQFATVDDRLERLEAATGNEVIRYDEIYTTYKFPGEYVFYGTFVVSLGESVSKDGERPFVTRLWANGEEIYNTYTGVIKPGLSFEFYDGNETQGVVYRDMHYRGLMCLVFRDMNLTDFGNSYPAITAELYDSDASVGNTYERKTFSYDTRKALSVQLSKELNRIHKAMNSGVFAYGWMAGNYSYLDFWSVDTGSLAPVVKTGAAYFMPNNGAAFVAWFPEIAATVAYLNDSFSGFALGVYEDWNGSLTYAQSRFTIDASNNSPSGFAAPYALARMSVTARGVVKHYAFMYNADGDGNFGVLAVPSARFLRWAANGDKSISPWFTPFNPSLPPNLLVGRESDGETVGYVQTHREIGKIVFRPSSMSNGYYPDALDHSVNAKWYDHPGDLYIQQCFYDTTNNRVVAIIIKVDNVTAYAVAINDDGSIEWTSPDFPRPPIKLGDMTGEGTSDLSKGTLVLTRAGSATVLTKLNILTGEVEAIPSSNLNINPTQLAVWDSRTNRLWTGDLSYVEVGSPTPTLAGGDTDFTGSLTISELLNAYAKHVGYSPADVRTVNTDHMKIYGYVVSNNGPISDLAGNLGGIYGFNWFSVGDEITFKSAYDADGVIVLDATLTEDQLATLSDNIGAVDSLSVSRNNDNAAPASASFTYFDINNDFKSGNIKAQRGQDPLPTHKSQSKLDFTVPVSMEAEQAQKLVYGMIARAWAGKVAYSIRIPSDGLIYEPVDVVKFDASGRSYTGIVSQTRINADFSVSLTLTEAAGAVHPAVVEAQPPRVTPSAGLPARVVLFDVPDLLISDYQEGFFNIMAIAGSYDFDSFSGAIVEQVSADDPRDVTPLLVFTAEEQGYTGVVLEPPAFWPDFEYLDTLNSLVIKADNIPAERFVTATEAEMIAGANLVVIGNRESSEYLQFGDFEYLGDNRWRLYNLLRGRFGTDAMAGTVMPSANFAFLDNHKLFQYRKELVSREDTIKYRSRSPRQSPWQVNYEYIEPVGNSRKPYAPVDVYGYRNENNDIRFEWVRRARVYNNPPTPFEPMPPLDELFNEWLISITDENFGGAYRDAFFIAPELDKPSYNYLTYLQELDGNIIGDVAYLRLHQQIENKPVQGFSYNYTVSIVDEGSVLLKMRFDGGGAMAAQVEIEAIPTMGVHMDGGGAMSVNIAREITLSAAMGLGGSMGTSLQSGYPIIARFDGGGSLSIDLETPHYLRAVMAGGGDMETDLVRTVYLRAVMSLGGAMETDVTNSTFDFVGTLATLSADGVKTGSVSNVNVAFDTLNYNYGGWSLSGNAVVIPAGVTHVDIEAAARMDDLLTAAYGVFILVNGVIVASNRSRSNTSGGYVENVLAVSRINYPVNTGDTVSLQWVKASASTRGMLKAHTYLSIRKVQ